MAKKELIKIDFTKVYKKMKNISFNITDMIILTTCYKRDLSISTLQRDIGITYKNILPHIRKLEKSNIIKLINKGKGKEKIIIVNEDQKNLALIYGLSEFFGIGDFFDKYYKK